MTTLAQVYASSTAFTLNSTSWAQAVTISSNAVDISSVSPVPIDIWCTVSVTFPNSTMGAQKAVNIWVSASEDGTIFDENDQYAGSNNSQTTLRSPTNFKGPIVLAATINIATATTFSLRAITGATLPKKFGLILENQCNQTITTKSASWTAINYTNT